MEIHDPAKTSGDTRLIGHLPFPPVMVAIAGASGSGKSTLAAELGRILGGGRLALDSYYRDLSHLPVEQRALRNFDDPSMIDLPLLSAHLADAAAGRAVERPVYDFSTHTRVAGRTEILNPESLILVEGLFSLYFPELRPINDLSVYLDTPDDVCFERRLKRDVEERGRTPEDVRRQYDATVRPCGLAFIRPLADFAHMVLEGTDALDFKVEQVMNALKKRGILARLGLGDSSAK